MAKISNRHKTSHFAAIIIFGLVALLHALRLIYSWPARIGNYDVPMWISWIGLVIGAALAVPAWQTLNEP